MLLFSVWVPSALFDGHSLMGCEGSLSFTLCVFGVSSATVLNTLGQGFKGMLFFFCIPSSHSPVIFLKCTSDHASPPFWIPLRLLLAWHRDANPFGRDGRSKSGAHFRILGGIEVRFIAYRSNTIIIWKEKSKQFVHEYVCFAYQSYI